MIHDASDGLIVHLFDQLTAHIDGDAAPPKFGVVQRALRAVAGCAWFLPCDAILELHRSRVGTNRC